MAVNGGVPFKCIEYSRIRRGKHYMGSGIMRNALMATSNFLVKQGNDTRPLITATTRTHINEVKETVFCECVCMCLYVCGYVCASSAHCNGVVVLVNHLLSLLQ